MNREELLDHLERQTKLYRLHGQMLAECPVTGHLSGCGVYHDSEGLVIYISAYGAEELGFETEERDLGLPEYLERHNITDHFLEPGESA